MTDKELLETIHYSEDNPTRAAELFKKITKAKKELDEIYESVRYLVKNDYKL